MQGFYSWLQLDICRPYFDKFFDCLGTLEQQHIYKYVEMFLTTMLPDFEVGDRHIVKLLKVKQAIPDTNVNYKKLVQDSIDNLIKQRKIRDLAAI